MSCDTGAERWDLAPDVDAECHATGTEHLCMGDGEGDAAETAGEFLHQQCVNRCSKFLTMVKKYSSFAIVL